MKEEKNIYIGNRYVPKIMGEWNKQEYYEGLSIVTFEGTSYTSKKSVPIGIDIINESYWSVTGNYNAQVEKYRQEVKNLKENYDPLKKSLDTLMEKNVFIESYKELNDIDYTEAFKKALVDLKEGGVLILQPFKTYKVKTIVINEVKNLKIKGRKSKIIYNNNEKNTTNDLYRLINITNSDNIKIVDITILGEFFNEINKEMLPTKEILNNKLNTIEHIGLLSSNNTNVYFENITTNDFGIGFYFSDTENFTLKNCLSYDGNTAFQVWKCKNGVINQCKSFDMRFLFNRIASGIDEPVVSTIGSSGSGFIIDKCLNITIDNSLSERSATNSFRIQGESKKIIVKNCIANQSRRHGFSVYDVNNQVTLLNCLTKKTSDRLFWNGFDNMNTFKRPTEEKSPVSFVFSNSLTEDGFNEIILIGCIADEEFYTKKPLSLNESGILKAVCPRRLLLISPKNQVSVTNSIFKGFTSQISIDVQGDTVFSNNKINLPTLSEIDSIPDRYSIRLTGKNNKLTGNTINGGRFVFVSGEHNVITNNTLIESELNGFYFADTKKTLVDNNIVIDVNNTVKEGVGFIYTNTSNMVNGQNTVIDTRVIPITKFGFSFIGLNEFFEPGKMLSVGDFNKESGMSTITSFSKSLFGKIEKISNSEAVSVENLVIDFNNLLTKMKESNLMN